MTCQGQLFGKFSTNSGEVYNSSTRDMDGPDSRCIGLYLPELFPGHHFYPFNFIFNSALIDLIKPDHFLFVCGDDHFPAHFIFHTILFAETHELMSSIHTISGPIASRPVVDARMNNPRIMPRLMGGHSILFFHHEYVGIRESQRKFVGSSNPDNPGPCNSKIVAHEAVA